MIDTSISMLQRFWIAVEKFLALIYPPTMDPRVGFVIIVCLLFAVLMLMHYLLKKLPHETRLGLAVVFVLGTLLCVLYSYVSRAFHFPPLMDERFLFHLFPRAMDPVFGLVLFACLLFDVLLLTYLMLRKVPLKIRLGLAAILLATPFLAVLYSYQSRAYSSRPMVFDGKSTTLKRTQIVPTLDTPIQPGKNAIWCASFQAMWKVLQRDLAKGPVQLEGADDACARLNNSPEPETPEGALYTASGWMHQGILDTIRREKAARFPGSAAPDFSEAAENSFVAYGYLEFKYKFPIPYFDSTLPITFSDSAGNKSKIRTFGIRGQDESKYFPLRNQVGVLVEPGSIKERPDDFAVDLCQNSKDTQIVFACVPFGPSLKETMETVEADIARAPKKDPLFDQFGANDTLLVPELAYRVVHEFEMLKGRSFLNELLCGQRMDLPRQDIMFRLDRSGTELMSESSAIALSASFRAIGDKPFLVYLKKRGAALPYFVMWVDNDELLMKWK